MLFHPQTLFLLLKHKHNPTDVPPLSLLALLTDYTEYIDIDVLFSVLFSYTAAGDKEKLYGLLMENAVQYSHGGKLLCMWQSLPAGVRRSLVANRRGLPRRLCCGSSSENIIYTLPVASKKFRLKTAEAEEDVFSDSIGQQPGLSEMDMESGGLSSVADGIIDQGRMPLGSPSTDKRRRGTSSGQTGVLNFAKAEAKKVEKFEKFAPLDLKNVMFVYNKNDIRLTTLRKRDDLVAPVRLQFIKHYDQRRPHIYQRRTNIIPAKRSYERLDGVLNYDYDSSAEWEELGNEEPEELESEMSAESGDSSGADSIVCPDSSASVEVQEETRYTKKPVFLYDQPKVVVYCGLSDYKNAFLETAHSIPEWLVDELRERKGAGMTCDRIAEVYNINPKCVHSIMSDTS